MNIILIQSFFKIVIISILGTVSLLAQKKFHSNFEVGGSILYSYSNNNLQYDNIQSFYKNHQLQFEPELGYYLNSNLELILDINYTMEYDKSGPIILNPDPLYMNDNNSFQMHRIGIFIGTAYNLKINEELITFIGTKIGVSERRWISTGQNQLFYYDSGWKKAELSFPSFFGGIKICINPNLTLLFKVQYIRTYRYEGYENEDNDFIVFGIGFLTFL